MEVKVDKNLCVACGACIALCPNVFQYGADGKAETKEGLNLDAEGTECAKRAEAVCPVKAISVKE